jgi:hypothetical protein
MKNLLTQNYRMEWRAQIDGREKDKLPKEMDQKPEDRHQLGSDRKIRRSHF